MQDKGWISFFNWLQTDYAWIIEVVLLVCALFVLHYFLKLLVRVIEKKFPISSEAWRGKLEYIIFKPLDLFLWVVGLSWIIDIIAHHYSRLKIIEHVFTLRSVLIIVVITWLIIRWKNQLQNILISKSHRKKFALDAASIEFIGKIATIIILFISILLVLQFLGIDIFPLIAFGGVGAAIVGFAGKDMFANLIGGFVLHVTRPFVRGDVVEIPSQSIYANVEEIGWYVTRMRDLEKRPIFIPNSFFSNVYIKNISRRTHRRIDEVMGIRYQDFVKVTPLIDQVRDYLKKQIHLDQDLPIQVYLQTFNTFSIDLVIRAYSLSTVYDEFMQIKQQVLMDIKKIMEKEGVEIAFPTSVVQLEKSL